MADSQKVRDVKTKKLDMSQRSYTTYHVISHTFFVAERMILVVSLNYQTFFGYDDDKATIQNYVLFKKKKKQKPQSFYNSSNALTVSWMADGQNITTCN